MAWKISSFAVLIFFLGGCASTQKAPTNESAKSSTERKENETISILEDATLSVRTGDSSTFASVGVTGRPFVLNVEYLPGKSYIRIVRHFNRRVEGELPCDFILVVGERKLAPLAWRDDVPGMEKFDPKLNTKEIALIKEGSNIGSTLAISEKTTTSLLFDLSADELAQPKQLFLRVELTHPKEKKLSFHVDLK